MAQQAPRPEATISEICSQAERLAQSDPVAAVQFLKCHRARDDFHPWGEVFSLRCAVLAQEGESDPECAATLLEAVRTQAIALFNTEPDLQACWPLVLRLTRRTNRYAEVTVHLLERMRCAQSLAESWLCETVMECLLNHSPDAGESVMDKALGVGLFSSEAGEGLTRLARFLESVRQDLREHPRVERWGFCFGQGPAARVADDGRVGINLSALCLSRIEGWELPLSTPFFTALSALLHWSVPVVDDLFLENWQTMRREDAHAGLFAQLMLPHLPKDKNTPNAAPKPKRLTPAQPEKGSLWVRVGNGQMWALHNYLAAPEETCCAARRIAEMAQAGAGDEIAGLAASDPWWPHCSPLANVARIAVNAGWYATPDTAERAFQDWAERYKSALERGHILAGHAHTFLPLVPLLPTLREKQLHELNIEAFLRDLDGLSVVFASAFANQVQAHFDQGGLHALWLGCGIPVRLKNLTCVMPPMSAWPYRPHRDWSESFAVLVHESEEAIRASGAQVFIGACGGYGMPLVEEIHRRTGITCVSMGHVTNTLFGIYTATNLSVPFYQRNRRLPHWVRGRLDEMYPEVRRIDRGRYVAPAPEDTQ
ncbi:hypothetical protein [Humidesulfovibrio idahonensis]